MNFLKKIPVAFILLSLAIFAFIPSGCAARRAPAALETARRNILVEFSRIDLELKRAAERIGTAGLTGDGARATLEDLVKALPYAVDVAAIDSTGKMVTIEPAAYRHFEGSDISDQEQVKRILDRRMPVMSAVFRTVEGLEATDVEYPVFGSGGAFLGSVSLLFSSEKLLDAALVPSAGGKSSIWVMETGGRILSHPEKSRIGTNFLAWDRLRAEEKLRRLAERFASEGEGRDAGRGAIWTTASLYDTAWRLIVFGWE